MKCLQKLYSSPSWLVVSLCLLCTLFLTTISTNSASAVSDLIVTYTSGTEIPSSTFFFPDVDYSQYNYIYFNFSNPSSSLIYNSMFNIRFVCRYPDSSSNHPVNYNLEYIDVYFALNDIKTCSSFFSNPNTSITLLSDLTITLTDKIPSFSSASGSISITSNGTYDVTNYAEAVVDVPPEVVQGDYHDDLVNLKQAIILVPAVCLVIYFFYAIYKMIMGGVRR